MAKFVFIVIAAVIAVILFTESGDARGININQQSGLQRVSFFIFLVQVALPPDSRSRQGALMYLLKARENRGHFDRS